MRKSLLLTAVLAALASSQAVRAEEVAAPAAAAATPTWTFPATASIVSDYIWHGQSQTWGNPAVQFGIEADHASGFYAGVWGSNVSSNWLPNANLEMDLSAGYRNTFLNDFKYDLGAVYIYYPNGNFNKAATTGATYREAKLNTVELYASLGWKWFTVKGGVNPTQFYGWNRDNSGSNGPIPNNVAAQSFYKVNQGVDAGGSTHGSGYVMASASFDLPQGFNLAGEIGHQMIADSTDLDWTWYKAGITKNFDGGWAVNAFYTATTGTDAYKNFYSFDSSVKQYTVDQDKVVVGVSKSF